MNWHAGSNLARSLAIVRPATEKTCSPGDEVAGITKCLGQHSKPRELVLIVSLPHQWVVPLSPCCIHSGSSPLYRRNSAWALASWLMASMACGLLLWSSYPLWFPTLPLHSIHETYHPWFQPLQQLLLLPANLLLVSTMEFLHHVYSPWIQQKGNQSQQWDGVRPPLGTVLQINVATEPLLPSPNCALND